MKIAIVRSVSPRWPKMKWLAEAFAEQGHTVRTVTSRRELPDVDRWADACIFQQRSVVR